MVYGMPSIRVVCAANNNSAVGKTCQFGVVKIYLIMKKDIGWVLYRSGPESDIEEERRQMYERCQ